MLKYISLFYKLLCRVWDPSDHDYQNIGFDCNLYSTDKLNIITEELKHNIEHAQKECEKCSIRSNYILVLNGVIITGLIQFITKTDTNHNLITILSVLLIMSTSLILFTISRASTFRRKYNNAHWNAYDFISFDMNDIKWFNETTDMDLKNDYLNSMNYMHNTIMKFYGAFSSLISLSVLLTSIASSLLIIALL